MPTPHWTDYNADPDLNNATPPTGAPEGWAGPQVNLVVRYLMAVVRRLGDATPQLSASAADSDDPDDKIMGSLGAQDKDGVEILGGSILNTAGSVPVGGIINFYGTLAEALATAAYGWAICDGRTLNGMTTPDMRDRFARGAGGANTPKSMGGVGTQTSGGSSAANTGATVLTDAHLPAHDFVTDAFVDNDLEGVEGGSENRGVGKTVVTGLGTGHAHTMAHTHAVILSPLCCYMYFLMRTA